MVGTLSVGTLTEAHIIVCELKRVAVLMARSCDNGCDSVDMLWHLRSLGKRHHKHHCGFAMMTHDTARTHSWCATSLCSRSFHVSFNLVNGECNSVTSRNGCYVDGVNAIHTVSFLLVNTRTTAHNHFTPLNVHLV